jgi:hypothetical protein
MMFFSQFALAKVVIDCPEGQYPVRSHPRRAYFKADGTFVRATQVSKSCRERTKEYDFWFGRLKDGPPPSWPHKAEKSAQWTDDERQRVLEALGELPEELWDQTIKGIYRLKRSKDHPNPSSYGGSMIVLYDNAFGEDRRLARLIAHEIAHHKYAKFENEDIGTSYRRATGWRPEIKGRDFYWTGRKDGYVEEDGAREPDEDFANNLDHFLFDPERLQKVTPKAYDWIKKQFSDKFKIKRSTP